VDPYAVMVGGFHYQAITPRDADDHRQDRFTTVALSRVGITAHLQQHLSLESEFEVNAGPHGSSVWEGQAALQVRNQLLRVDWHGLTVDVGRITDPTSLDYFSAATANLLLSDEQMRFPLLMSGFNRGNGVLVRYEVVPGLRFGITVNAGNPTSTTATVQVGGTFPPFARFYEVPASHVGRDPRSFPDDSFHVVLVSPSVSYETDRLRAQASLQYFVVDVNANTGEDQNIAGYNLRGGVQLRLLDGAVQPFVNVARHRNDTVLPTDSGRLSNADSIGLTTSGGIDFRPWERLVIGGQYAMVREETQGATVQMRHFANVGASLALFDAMTVDARYGYYTLCEDGTCGRDGEHSVWLTAKATLGPALSAGRRP
jgi:hypothetical protein